MTFRSVGKGTSHGQRVGPADHVVELTQPCRIALIRLGCAAPSYLATRRGRISASLAISVFIRFSAFGELL
jgi:hypothetical protein